MEDKMESCIDMARLKQELSQERETRLEYEVALDEARARIEELRTRVESQVEKVESMKTELNEADRRQNSLESALFSAINSVNNSPVKSENSNGEESDSFDSLDYVSCSSLEPLRSPRKRANSEAGNRSFSSKDPSVESEYLDYVKGKLEREQRRGMELEDKLKELMQKFQEKETEWQQKEREIESEMERCKKKLKEECKIKEMLSSESDSRAVEFKNSIQNKDAMIIKLQKVVETESQKVSSVGTELKQFNSLVHKKEVAIVQLQNQLNDAINKIVTLQDQVQELQGKHKRDIQKFVETMRRQRVQLNELRLSATWDPYGSVQCQSYRSRLSLQIQEGLEHFLFLKPPNHEQSRVDLEPEWE